MRSATLLRREVGSLTHNETKWNAARLSIRDNEEKSKWKALGASEKSPPRPLIHNANLFSRRSLRLIYTQFVCQLFFFSSMTSWNKHVPSYRLSTTMDPRVITTPPSLSASFLRCFSSKSASGLVANLASSVVSPPSPSPDSHCPVCIVPIHRHDLRCVAKPTPLDSEQIQCPQYGVLQHHRLELSGT